MKIKNTLPLVKVLLFSLLVFLSNMVNAQAGNKTDEQGRKQGEWIKMKPDGKVNYKGQFKDDKPFGKFKYYGKDGSIITILEFTSPDSALATHYHSNGKKSAFGYYVNQQKEGVWRFYDRKGVISSKVTYVNGHKEGPYIVYNLNGSVSRETAYKNDIENGYRKTFDSQGNMLTEGAILDGQMDGMQKIYRGGKINIQGAYKNAVREGDWIYYDENGKQYKLEHYELGNKTN
tara:strand:+ start:2832 stop:3527 length:696 start_codon:yes stop_codon:yes gene_type:complete